MSHAGDAGPDNPGDAVRHLCAALEFYAIAGAFRHKTARTADRRLDRRLVGHVRHIADQPGIRRAAPYSLYVRHHHILGYRQG